MINKKYLTNPKVLMCFLVLVNILNYIDRGIIPGSPTSFDVFIMDTLNTEKPDVYLGLLQSSFIIGFIVSSLIVGYAVHFYPPFFLCGVGCLIWLVAVICSGLSYYVNSYYFLLCARVFSGVAEASFQNCIPPWITRYSPKDSTGLWIGYFYACIPLGTALGYTFSGLVASKLGWQYSFFIVAAVISPYVPLFFYVSSEFPIPDNWDTTETLSVLDESEGGTRKTINETKQVPSLKAEVYTVLSNWIWVLISIGSAAQCGSLIGLGTYGSSFGIALGYFDDEASSSTIFGLVLSLSGLFGSYVGGVLVDIITVKELKKFKIFKEDSENDEFFNKQLTIGPRKLTVKEAIVLKALVMITMWASLIGTILLCGVSFCATKSLFFLVAFFGCTIDFITTAPMNYSTILSVVSSSSSLAIGLNSGVQHLFGDVPSPIIVGFIKDELAPQCTGSIEQLTSDACRSEAQGIKNTMLITNIWGFWTFISSALLYVLINRKLQSIYYANIDDNIYYNTVASDNDDTDSSITTNQTPLIAHSDYLQ